ncbi:hypothetical protein [Helicobacter cetorum]|uniref:hypothetical protein n=1 Tax=Helicobacter cetorum TaxID=138563 RepID=UPI0013153F1D|nr:hypothetical protein [Helicobacter cetorum]
MQKIKDFINKYPGMSFIIGYLILILLVIINHLDKAIGSVLNALFMLSCVFLYYRVR